MVAYGARPCPSPAPLQQAASRANGAASRGPETAAGKARAAANGTRHGLRGGDFALLPGEDADELASLRRAVAADWAPRDAYERHWAEELVAAMWRQRRLRGLEFAALDAAAAEAPPSEVVAAPAAHLRPLRRPHRRRHRPCPARPALAPRPARGPDRRRARAHARTRAGARRGSSTRPHHGGRAHVRTRHSDTGHGAAGPAAAQPPPAPPPGSAATAGSAPRRLTLGGGRPLVRSDRRCQCHAW